MKYKNIIFYIPCLALTSTILSTEFIMPHPQETLEQVQRFESLKILQEARYKTSDTEIREHIKGIHKTSPNAYRYFCEKLQTSRSAVIDSLESSMESFIEIKKTEHPGYLPLSTLSQTDVPEAKGKEIFGIDALSPVTQRIVDSYYKDHVAVMPQKIYLTYDNNRTDTEHNCLIALQEAKICVQKESDDAIEAFMICHELSHAGDLKACRHHYVRHILRDLKIFEKQKQAFEIKMQEIKKRRQKRQPQSWGNFFWSYFSQKKSSETKEENNNAHKPLPANPLLSEIKKNTQWARQSSELIADALASNNKKEICRAGYKYFGAHLHEDSPSHPACAVRMHQMAILHRYYKIEQNMCKEYALMGYQHGNLFS